MRPKRQIFKFFLAFTFLLVSQPLFAQNSQFFKEYINDDIYKSRISEYFFSRSDKEILRPVRLIGGVQKPGLYHLPVETSLMTLIAISGGPTSGSDLGSAVLKRNGEMKRDINLRDLIASSNDLQLKEGDVIYIPEKHGWIDQPTALTVSTIATVIATLVTVFVVIDNKD